MKEGGGGVKKLTVAFCLYKHLGSPLAPINNTPQISRLERRRGLLEVCVCVWLFYRGRLYCICISRVCVHSNSSKTLFIYEQACGGSGEEKAQCTKQMHKSTKHRMFSAQSCTMCVFDTVCVHALCTCVCVFVCT